MCDILRGVYLIPSLNTLYPIPLVNLKKVHSDENLPKVVLSINPLSANPTKWSNTLKQFADSNNLPTNCLSVFDHFVGLALKGLRILLPFT